jgi:hypothetical protein
METGFYPSISHTDYHGMTDFVSNSYLGKLAKCPAAAKIQQEDSPAFAFGRACHCYILEGDAEFLKHFCVAPVCDKRTKEGKAVFAEFQAANEGKDVVTADDMLKLVTMREAVYQHPAAAELLALGAAEQTAIWQDAVTGIMCKCRPDWIPKDSRVIVDLKTTTDAGAVGFGRSVASYGYARQAALYLDGVNAATGGNYNGFLFIAVEKEAPHRVEVYELDEEFIDYGREEYGRLLELEWKCRDAGEYPNRQSDGVVMLNKPKYL